jgi:F0F1-type ATP synthase assembly protein I
VDLHAKRELNNGFGNALARAVELTVSPVIFGFFGYLIDGWFGTRPIVMVFLFVFTFGYLLWRQLTNYDAAMKQEERKLFGRDGEATP